MEKTMKAKLINSLGCEIDTLITAHETDGKAKIIKEWLPLMQPGDNLIYCEEHED